MKKLSIFLALALLDANVAHAVQVPEPSGGDPRIRYVTYRAGEVTYVAVQRGTVTRIMLADDEKIVIGATGFPADCKVTNLEWCIHADEGANQVWVKPQDNATYNNLELHTNKRDYSIEFRVLSDARSDALVRPDAKALDNAPMYRVVYRYQTALPPVADVLRGAGMSGGTGFGSSISGGGGASSVLDSSRPMPRNTKYSVKAVDGGEEIVPSLIFDDGRFTYFRFPGNRPVPTIYQITSSGEEIHVNVHMEPTDPDLAVAELTGARFVLRLGKEAVGVWNDGYNAADPGVETPSGTTVAGVKRSLR